MQESKGLLGSSTLPFRNAKCPTSKKSYSPFGVKLSLMARSTSNGQKYPVKTTSKRRLKQVDFQFDGHELRGLEQNPDTKSRWAKMAREGNKVMQFLDSGRYVAVVVDGKVKTYG
jgi:hypothetical protein